MFQGATWLPARESERSTVKSPNPGRPAGPLALDDGVGVASHAPEPARWRMDRGDHQLVLPLEHLSMVDRHAEVFAQDGLRSRCSQRDYHGGLDLGQLSIEPRSTGPHIAGGGRLLMKAFLGPPVSI